MELVSLHSKCLILEEACMRLIWPLHGHRQVYGKPHLALQQDIECLTGVQEQTQEGSHHPQLWILSIPSVLSNFVERSHEAQSEVR